MTEKKGKRAVIISNIKSNSIEQAIFILKSPAYDASFDAGSGIVAEAQEIINSYINTIEKNTFGKRKKLTGKTAVIAGALCLAAVFVISVLLKF